MKRHHYLVTLKVSAPAGADLDDRDVEQLLLGPGGDDVRHPLRVEDVDVGVFATDVEDPEEPSLSAEDRNPGLEAVGR